MEPGEKILIKIFRINERRDKEAKIIQKIKQLCKLEIPLSTLENLVHLLDEVRDNDEVNDYIEKITKKDKDLKFKNIKELVDMLQPDLDDAKRKLEKLKELNPLVSFLSEECKDNLDEDMNNLIDKINRFQLETCQVKYIIAIDKMKSNQSIKKLIDIENAFILPFNVFYRFSLKKLFEDEKIRNLDSLFTNIENIKDETRKQITIKKIKGLEIQEFKDEIIQKTQDLMKAQLTKMSNNESKISNLVYKRIESYFLEFSELSDGDKLFLQTTVSRIMHFDDFKKLGSFCDKYFESEVSQPDEVKCFLDLFQKEDPLITKFQQFGRKYKDNKLFKEKISEIENDDWPKFKEMGIEVQQTSQFFTFWHCITQLITLRLDDEKNESVLLPTISNFLKDKNIYNQFQKKMQQAYIEPTIQNYYVIFESLMKLLNASNIANSKSDFKNVSKLASTYFQENPSEFYKISNGIDVLLNNEDKIIQLFSTDRANAVIEEYDFVKRVIDKDLFWQISFKDHIQLIKKKNGNQVVADFVKLRLIAAKLNVVMIRTENISKSDECRNSEDFVKFFQTAETLYDKLSILHELKFDIGDKEVTNESLDSTQIEELNNKLDRIIQIINEKFTQLYEDDICLFTKEHFFTLYQLLNKYSKNRTKSLDLVSIFE